VYLEEGEPDLSIRQYNKAYDMRKSFYIPDSQYEVLYRLAKVYRMQQMYGQMEQTLLSITADDRHFVETPTFQLKSQIESNYMRKGLDHVLMLYVFDDQFAASAHSTLGWYYYRTGRQSEAIRELLYSLISRTTEIVSFLHGQDVDYEYSNLTDMLALALKNKESAVFIAEADFFKDLYYLACATSTSGYPQSAATLWKLLASAPSAGSYQDLSKRQLKKSWTEPLLLAPLPQ
jgi:tetratricopeptide (TPR) repeat protein